MSDTFHSGDVSPDNSIYRAIHLNHNLTHEVTVLREQAFPECIRCGDAVRFQVVRRLHEHENASYAGFQGMLSDQVA
jgi:hypothetical protein